LIPTTLGRSAPSAPLSSTSDLSIIDPAPSGSPASASKRSKCGWRDADVLIALGALWLVSVIRVAGAATRHEVFGAEATLAFLSMLAIPWLVVRARLSRGPGAHDERPDDGHHDADARPHAPARPPLRLVK
jgi:hypothetical protein